MKAILAIYIPKADISVANNADSDTNTCTNSILFKLNTSMLFCFVANRAVKSMYTDYKAYKGNFAQLC